MKNISITKKAFLAFAILAAGVLIMSAVSISRSANLHRSVTQTSETFALSARAFELVGEINGQNNKIKAYLLTGDLANVKGFNDHTPRIQDLFTQLDNQLDRLKAGSAAESATTAKQRVAAAKDGWRKWREGFTQRQLDLMKNPVTVDLARAYEVTGEGEALVQQVRGDLNAVTDDLSRRASANQAQQQDDLSLMDRVLFVGAGAVLALAILLAFLNHRLVSSPLRELTVATGALSSGDTSVQIGQTGRRDEIGQLAASLLVFKDNLIRTREMEEEQRRAEARAVEERRNAMHRLADQFQDRVGSIVDRLSGEASQLLGEANKLSVNAQNVSMQTLTIGGASEQASHNVQTVAAAAEELSVSITEVAQQIGNTSTLASRSQQQAIEAGEMIGKLAAVVARVSSVTDLIETIARGTNLLALNATVEAARAGEAGRGFAVVASEVKQLAEQTAKATDEINQQIAEMNNVASSAIQAVSQINEMIREMTENAAAVAAAAEEQGTATREIAHNVHAAATGTEQVKSSIAGMAETTGETKDASQHVASASATLTQQASTLKEEMSSFIAHVRAA